MIDQRALEEIAEVFKHFKKIGASHEQSASLTLAYAHLKSSTPEQITTGAGPHLSLNIKPGKKKL